MPLDGQEPLASRHEVHVVDILTVRVARKQMHRLRSRRTSSPVGLEADGLEHDWLQFILRKSTERGIERKIQGEFDPLDDAMPEVVCGAEGVQGPARLNGVCSETIETSQ